MVSDKRERGNVQEKDKKYIFKDEENFDMLFLYFSFFSPAKYFIFVLATCGSGRKKLNQND